MLDSDVLLKKAEGELDLAQQFTASEPARATAYALVGIGLALLSVANQLHVGYVDVRVEE